MFFPVSKTAPPKQIPGYAPVSKLATPDSAVLSVTNLCKETTKKLGNRPIVYTGGYSGIAIGYRYLWLDTIAYGTHYWSVLIV